MLEGAVSANRICKYGSAFVEVWPATSVSPYRPFIDGFQPHHRPRVLSKRSFPNTGLPGNKNNLPLIPLRLLEGLAQFMKHTFPAHKFAVRSG